MSRGRLILAIAVVGMILIGLLLVPRSGALQVASAAPNAAEAAKPAAEKPAQPGAKRPMGGKRKAAAKQPGANQPAANKPATNTPAAQAAAAAVAAGDIASLPVEALPDGTAALSSGDSYDDFASVAQASDGTLWAAYAAYYDAHDQIRLHRRLANGNWSARMYVPLVEARADIWMPQLAVDAKDRLWVIWAEQIDRTRTESGNWELFARALDGNAWGKIVRLTNDPRPDINPHVVTDKQKNIVVVWQSHAKNNGDISYCRFDGEKWSDPLAVTSGEESDWYPSVAVDEQDTAWIAFDSYRNGDYDVFLTSVSGNKPGKVVPIADSKYYEAHASVACTPDGQVWVAWEQGGYNWGKDQGHWLKISNAEKGTPLGSTRNIRVISWKDGRHPAEVKIDTILPEENNHVTAMATLATGDDGRLWLRFRHQKRAASPARPNNTSKYWTEQITSLTEKGWAPLQTLAASNGRISVFSRILPLQDGGLAVAYSSDQRSQKNFHQPIHDRALVAVLKAPAEAAGTPPLEVPDIPEPPKNAFEWDEAAERKHVAAAREYRVKVDGQTLQIVRGDLHRHTEMSWDVGPGNDGSYLDFYRYMIDVAAMDFGSLTDHQGGGHYAYHWWLTEKSADMYYLPPRFVPLYGYERSAKFPNGHRNIFHSYRGVPVFAFQVKSNLTGTFPGIGAGDLLDNDTKLLYEYLRRTGGVAISHTSATDSMGTDWRDNDPEIEPVVEIYQGARNSSEVEGGPRVHDPSGKVPAPGGYQTEGMVWNALAKGYRLGMTSSSDHGSTHQSYSLVYVKENKREAILDGIRRRHTYGATDNLVVESWANGHFQGDEFKSSEKPTLELRVQGTDAISRVDLIRNNNYVYTTSPLKEKVEIKYTDMSAKSGLNYYYFRIQQVGGDVAWASPVWINYSP